MRKSASNLNRSGSIPKRCCFEVTVNFPQIKRVDSARDLMPTRGKMKISFMTRALVLSVALSAFGLGTAHGISTLTARYTGLYVIDSGNVVGEINYVNNTNNIYSRRGSADPQGERFLIQTPIFDHEPANGRGVYSRIDWWSIGYYCYVNGIGVGDSSYATQACQTDWNSEGISSSGNHFNSSWSLKTFSRDRNATHKSQRAEIRICEDQTLWTSDVCSSPRVVGIDWN